MGLIGEFECHRYDIKRVVDVCFKLWTMLLVQLSSRKTSLEKRSGKCSRADAGDLDPNYGWIFGQESSTVPGAQ